MPFPTATVSTQKVLLAKADTLLGSAVARFEQAMTLIKAARIGIANLRNSLTGVYEVIKEQLKPLIEQYRQITELVKAVKELPKEVAAEFKGLLGDIKELKAFAKEGYRGVIADVSQQLEAIRKADAPKITTGKDTNAAAQAMADLVQDTLLVKVAQWVASMPVATTPVKLSSTPSVAQQADQPVTRQEVPVTDEMQALQKAGRGAAIDPMLDKAGPTHYQAINDVQGSAAGAPQGSGVIRCATGHQVVPGKSAGAGCGLQAICRCHTGDPSDSAQRDEPSVVPSTQRRESVQGVSHERDG